jgi:hypothetical protein
MAIKDAENDTLEWKRVTADVPRDFVILSEKLQLTPSYLLSLLAQDFLRDPPDSLSDPPTS